MHSANNFSWKEAPFVVLGALIIAIVIGLLAGVFASMFVTGWFTLASWQLFGSVIVWVFSLGLIAAAIGFSDWVEMGYLFPALVLMSWIYDED